MDKYFECEEVSEDRRVKFTATKLKRHAALWWDSVQNERKRLNKASIKTWSRMVAKLKGRFLLRDYQIALHRQVQNLRHKGLTIREYTKEFYRVNLRARYIEDTTERITRYVNGLRLDILDEINILSPNNTEEVYQSAMKLEEKITKAQNARRGEGASRGKGQSYGRGQTANNNEEASSSKAFGSTDRGDSAREEAKKPPQEAENVPEIGEALVLHKVLLKPVKEVTEQMQWKALFRTICKSRGKCCKLIIDNVSTDNLVSTAMVEKLDLKCSKHHNPYRVSWLKEGHQLLVDEQSKVEFQIGRYKDKVVCDIMPMDVCHILLGRPWQYDRKVVHDGLTNCYKFVKDGIKHMLVPIREEGTSETSKPRTLLVSGNFFLKQVEDSEISYAVVKEARTVLLHTEVLDLPTEI
eukprot:PITA_09609